MPALSNPIARAVRCWMIGAIMSAGSLSHTAEFGEWRTARLGNVFVRDRDRVELRLETDVKTLAWEITDFFGELVERGTCTSRDGVATMRPKVGAVGYYLLKVWSDGGEARYTSFAIVSAHEPRDPERNRFGVMTHFAQGMSPEILPTLKQAGIGSIRDEHYWAEVEAEKGRYAFPKKSDAYMDACRAAGIEPLVELTFGNRHYDHPEGPVTPGGFLGYASYGRAVLKRYGEQIRTLEIWNEYNGSWAPPEARVDLASRVRLYTEMLQTAYRTIKSERPDVQVLGGAAVLIPLPYFEGIFKLGGLDSMDGVVIHPYRPSPEGVDEEVEALRSLIRQYNGGRDKPIWVTETGHRSRAEHEWERGRGMFEKGRAEAARYLVRQYTLLLKAGVERIYWYLACDHGDFAGMGLLRHHGDEPSGMGRYAVAPAYVAYANLIRHLDGARFVRREAETPHARAHVYLFEHDTTPVRVAWATKPTRIRLRTEGPLLIADIMGRERAESPVDGKVVLALTESALFIRGPVESVEELREGGRILANSRDDYGNRQAARAWTYGYYDRNGVFRELVQRETMWGHEWGEPERGLPHLRITADTMHPERWSGIEIPAVLRWTSFVSGNVILEGWLANGEEGPTGNGVELRLSVDGREVHSLRVGGGERKEAAVALPVEVRRGSRIDFELSSAGDTAYDATRYEFTIREESRR